jgi:hypothetical protein
MILCSHLPFALNCSKYLSKYYASPLVAPYICDMSTIEVAGEKRRHPHATHDPFRSRSSEKASIGSKVHKKKTLIALIFLYVQYSTFFLLSNKDHQIRRTFGDSRCLLAQLLSCLGLLSKSLVFFLSFFRSILPSLPSLHSSSTKKTKTAGTRRIEIRTDIYTIQFHRIKERDSKSNSRKERRGIRFFPPTNPHHPSVHPQRPKNRVKPNTPERISSPLLVLYPKAE